MRSRTLRPGRALAAVVLTLGGVACRTEPRPADLALDSSGVSTWGFEPVAGETLVVGLAPLRVLAPITLDDAAVEMESGDVTLLTSRVSLLACDTCRRRPDVPSYPGYAGSSCTLAPWPPDDFGPTVPIGGFRVQPGDFPSILVYLKPESPTARTRAVVVRYRDDRGRPRTFRIDNEHIEIKPPDTPEGDGCAGSMWFGDDDPQAGRVISPSPS